MKKVLAGLILLVIVLGLYFSSISFASTAGQNNSVLPEVEKIKEKKHFNYLVTLDDKNKQDNYLDGLNEKELLTAIAETAEELDKKGSFPEIAMFAAYVDKKLIGNLKEEEYISILQNPEYSTPFKVFMIDTYSYSRSKNQQKIDAEFNQVLKKIIKDKNNDPGLRFYAISTVDDFNQNDVQSLTEILNSEKGEGYLTAATLKALKEVNERESFNISKNILKNYQSYPIEEVQMAMHVVASISDNTLQEANDVDNRFEDVDNIIKTSNDTALISGAVFALGDVKTDKSVKTVINNRQKINDDGLIRYYIDKNYLAIAKMLDTNDDASIKIALTCVDIAPFKNFKPKLEELISQSKNEDIKNQAGLLIEKIDKNSYEHNIKWDYND